MLVISGRKTSIRHSRRACFNLAIEMLVISGQAGFPLLCHPFPVSISQSRCLSFQVPMQSQSASRYAVWFQSRNRDACHFRHHKASTAIVKSAVSISQSRCLSFQDVHSKGDNAIGISSVSISQSRCLSFQVQSLGAARLQGKSRFNLAIEMLVISGSNCPPADISACRRFQSRNRDACHFRRPPA